MRQWYLLTTKLKSELRVKLNLASNHQLETFFPTYPARKKKSSIGLPLFARYVFVHCNLAEDFQKIQYTPGVVRLVCFGDQYVPVPDEVIDYLKSRCNEQGQVLNNELEEGQKVRVTTGVFEGCEGIIKEKRGNRRIQLLHRLAYGKEFKIEVDVSEIEATLT